MNIARGTLVKLGTGDKIRITGSYTVRGKYLYTFRDEAKARGIVSRVNLLKALEDGARIVQ